jgi:hypothetical protein
LDVTVPISLSRLVLLLRRLRVPQVDVQTLDLFDQQENRLPGRTKLLIAVGKKTRSPGAELLDLALIQTIAQRPTKVYGSLRRLGQSPLTLVRPQASARWRPLDAAGPRFV